MNAAGVRRVVEQLEAEVNNGGFNFTLPLR